jgi:hypothetical protein
MIAIPRYPDSTVEIGFCGEMFVIDADQPALITATPAYPVIVIHHAKPAPQRRVVKISYTRCFVSAFMPRDR